jgi:hypothetical protein
VVAASAEVPPAEEEGILQREFDLPAEDLKDPYFIDLVKAKMVQVIESEDQLVTVSLRIRLGAPENEVLVRRSVGLASLTSRNVFWSVMEGSIRLCGYPEMMALYAETIGELACPDASSRSEENEEDSSLAPAPQALPKITVCSFSFGASCLVCASGLARDQELVQSARACL